MTLVPAALLQIEDLRVTFETEDRSVAAVTGATLGVGAGQTVGVVGESGCGKSQTFLAALGLLPKRGVQVSGRVDFDGRPILGRPDAELRRLRGKDVAIVFQDAMSALNPVLPIGLQITETLTWHLRLDRAAARMVALGLLERVGIPDPERAFAAYPHQLSGGMLQRVLISIAIACKPKLLIADEPTTALDVTIQAQILELLRELIAESQMALILISHDLGVVAGMCTYVNVMYAGRVVEAGTPNELFHRPGHPYTEGLLNSVPRLELPRGSRLATIAGGPQDAIAWDDGCAFYPRCSRHVDACLSSALRPIPVPSANGAPHLVRCVHAKASPDRDE